MYSASMAGNLVWKGIVCGECQGKRSAPIGICRPAIVALRVMRFRPVRRCLRSQPPASILSAARMTCGAPPFVLAVTTRTVPSALPQMELEFVVVCVTWLKQDRGPYGMAPQVLARLRQT
jgi:hypothetical protein